jgi:asparagine synthase (glutamine-hydrolysing)
MCGINGFVSRKKISPSDIRSKVNSMNELIYHRGPDDHGVYQESTELFSLGMGMRRLSIIDLTNGHQPMSSPDGNVVLVFNGEIYNFQQLKKDLIQKGHVFDTDSDTEVILKLYLEGGSDAFQKLDGMFAFSLFDKKMGKVFIARDFFGEKPLYFSKADGEFIWGSELKSILKYFKKTPSLDYQGLNLFFRLTYIPAPYTIYEGVSKLEPYTLLSYDLKTHEYRLQPLGRNSLSNNKPSEYPDFDTAKQRVHDLVQASVVSRSISDVPLGTFLSGGVDSSIVSLCLSQEKSSPIETFSIGFKKKSFDETDKSRLVAKLIGSNHHEFIIDDSDFEEDLHRVLQNFDEPFADSSALPSYLVSKKTREHVTVALTGDGGDEVFGGYNKYYMGLLNRKYTKNVPRSFHNIITKAVRPLLRDSSDNRGKRYKLNRLLNSIDYNGKFYWDIISLGFTSEEIRNYLISEKLNPNPFSYYSEKTGIKNPGNLNEFRAIDREISLEGDMLVKVDRTSMLNSLECRAPFLNKELWEYSNTLPDDYLLNKWNKKFILKEAFKDYFPEGFLDKSKSGFVVPVGDWLRTSLKKELESFLDPKLIGNQDFFQQVEITSLVKDHLSGKRDSTYKVWAFYCFQKWFLNQNF